MNTVRAKRHRERRFINASVVTDIKAAVKIFIRQMGSRSPRPIFTTSVDVDGSFSDSHIKSSFPKSLRPLTAKKEKNKKPSARKKTSTAIFFSNSTPPGFIV